MTTFWLHNLVFSHFIIVSKLQVVRTKLGIPDFKGIPFENYEDEAELFRKRWNSTVDFFKKNIKRDLKRNPEKVEHHIDRLMKEKMLCSHDYHFMAQFSAHPPRLPYKPP